MKTPYPPELRGLLACRTQLRKQRAFADERVMECQAVLTHAIEFLQAQLGQLRSEQERFLPLGQYLETAPTEDFAA